MQNIFAAEMTIQATKNYERHFAMVLLPFPGSSAGCRCHV